MKSSNTPYTFFELPQKEILIIFQTWERPDVYFKDLISDIREYTLDAVLYFDLLTNNGLNDRFYVANFESGELKINSFRKVAIADEYSKIANDFFTAHWDIIEDSSVLTPIQKVFFKKRISI